MSQVVKPISSRSYVITSADNGLVLTLGPAATSSSVGTFVVQFNPDVDSDYQAVVMGRCWGPAAADKNVPFVPIPYRKVTVANVAQKYEMVSDTVSGATLIQVPANWEVGLLVSCSAGTCSVCSWDLAGSSNP